ncbi:hypothetical protein C8R45DRAFT_1090781 [Mycena sanguinolenta]|nr:hypothetical protein C8R45DRAFT_1090781 [Mycena sanguinolenta]
MPENNGSHTHTLLRRAPRRINIPRCSDLSVTNTDTVLLGAGDYVRLDPNGPANGTTLVPEPVGGPPVGQAVNQEHVFELGYIGQFVAAAPLSDADCNWVQENLIDYVRADGSTMGLALVQAIDTTPNMVWVDKPLNQAKSNVVNQNSDTATNPPYLANMNRIPTFGTFAAAAPQIYKVEFFLRNLAAIGQYFGGTSQIFQATALRVQNLLSEITPSEVLVDDASLPLLFNQWLTNLINTYPNGCTSRGTNAWNYYNGIMNTMSAQLQQPIPGCFPLINGRVYNPSTFNPALLIPPAPALPRCNVPGTQGLIFYQEAIVNGQLPIVAFLEYGPGRVTIMGSGEPDFYAVGSGASISGSHVQGMAIDSNRYPSCAGSYIFNDVPAGTLGWSTAKISFDCGNGLGLQDIDGISYVVDGQDLPGCGLVRSDDQSPWLALCSITPDVNDLCVEEFVRVTGGTTSSLAISQLGFDVFRP